jgi:hypothetical protein
MRFFVAPVFVAIPVARFCEERAPKRQATGLTGLVLIRYI